MKVLVSDKISDKGVEILKKQVLMLMSKQA